MELVPFVLIQLLPMIHQGSAKNAQFHCQIASFAYQLLNVHNAQLDFTFIILLAFPIKLASTLPTFTLILYCKPVLVVLLLATLASIKHIALPVLLAICLTAIVWHIALRITITWVVHASNANFLAWPVAATSFAFPVTLQVSLTCLWSPTLLVFFTLNAHQEATFPLY